MSLKFPGWIALAFSIGLWLLATFAPDAFPDGLKLRIVYVGAAILFGAAIAALWHVRPSSWLTENVFWRLKAHKSDPISNLPAMLYVGETTVNSNNLANDNWLEVAIRFFNASRSHLRVRSVEGTIQCNIRVGSSAPDDHQHQLPTPSLLRDRSNIDDIAPLTEVMIVLQQHVGAQLAAELASAIMADGVRFFFDDLRVEIETLETLPRKANLPINGGVTLRNITGIIPRRIYRLQVNSVIGGAPSIGS
jgi:hypothetical protein